MQNQLEQDYVTYNVEGPDDQEITFSMEDLAEIDKEEREKKEAIRLENNRKKDKRTFSILVIIVFLFTTVAITSIIVSASINNIPKQIHRERERENAPYSTIIYTPSHVNFNEECLKSARSYIQTGCGFSQESLRRQLKYEGFTDSQIDYALEHL